MSERCLSACEVVPSTLKRCQLDAGHSGVHRWVEAQSDQGRIIAVWHGPDAARPAIVGDVTEIMPRGALSPIEDVIAAAERRAEAQWEREHTRCEHENIYQVLAGGEYCSDCGWKL